MIHKRNVGHTQYMYMLNIYDFPAQSQRRPLKSDSIYYANAVNNHIKGRLLGA